MSTKKQVSGLLQHSKESNEFVKECILTAMVQLAKDMDYHQITVTMLCKKAGVSRMAFYRNYHIINDVIYEIAYRLNQQVINTVGSPFRESTSKEWYINVFQLIIEKKDVMTLMFQENFQYQWMKIVNGFAVYDSRFPAEKKYQRLMWSGGFENIVSYWLNNGLKETPEELANYCMEYLPHLLIKTQ